MNSLGSVIFKFLVAHFGHLLIDFFILHGIPVEALVHCAGPEGVSVCCRHVHQGLRKITITYKNIAMTKHRTKKIMALISQHM